MNITSFSVWKLFGHKDLEIIIEDNKLIIVADNGSGKTIVLRIFFLFFSKQWNELLEYDFSKIVATIDGKEYIFSKSDYMKPKITNEIIAKLTSIYPTYKKFFVDELVNYSVDQLLEDDYILNDIEAEFDVPKSLLFSMLKVIQEYRFGENQYDWIGSFLYLPTYRRIERGFEHLYGDVNKRFEQHIRQIIPEIDARIEKEKNLDDSQYSETENNIRSIFDTIWSLRDRERWMFHKSNLNLEVIEFGMDDVQFRINNVFKNYPDNSQSLLLKYLEVCNKYLTNNKTLEILNTSNHLIVKEPITGKILPLTSLSAGEKHILSLFSFFLFKPENMWIIIDEPEISLSMKWQKNLLNDLLNFQIDGLLVATHSPFIVSDNFNKYTVGFNEFING